MDLDEGMEDIIRVMNQHPGVETIGSCSGHFRACRRTKAHNEDSMGLEDLQDWTLFCTSSTAPYVQFRAYPNQPDVEAFLGRMRNAPALPGGIHVHQSHEEWTVGAGDCGEMIISEEFAVPWSLPPRTAFAEFWAIFTTAWNASVVPELCITQLPSTFRLNDKCFQCGR